MLGSVIMFIWLRQRGEWYALYWAIGQAALTTCTVVGYLWHGPLAAPLAPLLCAGVAGFCCGTEHFLGTLRRRHLRPVMLATTVAALAVYILWSGRPEWIPGGMNWAVGLAFLWCALRLATGRHHFRFLAFVLLLRAAYNLGIACQILPGGDQAWIVFSGATKTVSLLCLIYLVHETIRQRYARTIDSLSSAFLILDRGGHIHTINQRGLALLGHADADAITGSHVAAHLPGMNASQVTGWLAHFAAAAPHYPYVVTTSVTLRGGQRLPVQLMASPYSERGQLYCMVQVIDLTDSKKKDALLYRAARYDTVTDVLNRHGLALALHEVLAEARNGSDCVVLCVDVDRFKRVNDAFGHSVGDQLLMQVAARLQAMLRDDDLLARFGSDEFVVVLPGLASGTAAAAAASFGELLIGALGASFALSRQTVTVSASIGMACYPEHGRDGDTLIRKADMAMHEAKKSGPGALRLFNEEMSTYTRQALVIDSALRDAIAAGELYLVYQPITDARNGALGKVEALLRWHSATLGPVPPDRFIPVAEDSGLIIELGTWVLHEACRQLAAWSGVLGPFKVSINVSARQLLDPAFPGLIEQALASHGLSAHQLELELTERVLIDDGASVRTTLARLSALGVSISLDDFGTGYSSLSYLTQFHINTLKIDRSFIVDIEHSERCMSLVATIVSMGHNLGMNVVAEGVETALQATMLARLGCNYVQGYYISKPLAPELLPGLVHSAR